MLKYFVGSLAALGLLAATAHAADLKEGLQQGSVELESIGPLAFGPEGLLFIGDPKAAVIFAVDTGDASGDAAKASVNVASLDAKLAHLLGTSPQEVMINDLAVNPASGQVYLSVSRGRGPDAAPVLLRVDNSGKISEVPLNDVRYSKAELPNAVDRESQGRNKERTLSITDLSFTDGRVFVAGLSNEDFDSKLRSIPFPFKEADKGTSVGIFHGAHGKFETNAPVRTFVPYDIGNDPHLLAAYTCTPLVKIPVSDLKAGAEVKGTTIAELGNRNRPLDMIVYEKDGKDYLLLANSSRGVMKIPTAEFASLEPISEPVKNEKAGAQYETIAELQGVEQLDKLNEKSAVIVTRVEPGIIHLQTIPLP